MKSPEDQLQKNLSQNAEATPACLGRDKEPQKMQADMEGTRAVLSQKVSEGRDVYTRPLYLH